MSREIKFRAWDKDLKIMRTVWILVFHPERVFVKNVVNEVGCWLDFNEVELMQFTGLKDCNGEDIFESDIVKWGNHCESCRECPIRIGEVVINPDIQFHAKNIDRIFDYGSFAYQDTSHLEVIGNIWQHPELLK